MKLNGRQHARHYERMGTPARMVARLKHDRKYIVSAFPYIVSHAREMRDLFDTVGGW